MNIDGYGTRNNSKTFEVILEADNEEQAFALGCALADKYSEIHCEIDEWNVVNIEKFMNIEEVRNGLIKDLENEYSKREIDFIDIRLEEIAEIEHMTLEELDYYCTANSSEMFSCIFNYKVFDKNNFEV